MRNQLISVCLVFLLLAVFPLTVAAGEFDPTESGAISVSLRSEGMGTPMAGAELWIFCVATVEYHDGTGIYTYTEDFAGCGFSLEDPELLQKLDIFLEEHPVGCRKIVTDDQGKGVCENLPLGLYYVKQNGQVEGFAPCAPFLVTVPMETEDGFVYRVDASPKTDAAKLVDITLRKVWNTDEGEVIPGKVTVQLLRGETVVATAVLNAQNNWQATYEDLPESDTYQIREVSVPQGFTATYSRSGYVFTVTNTSALAQTGQRIWPIPVFAMAGILLLMMGFVILRKPGKAHA